MRNPRKKEENLRSALITFAMISMVLGGIACGNDVSDTAPRVDTGDAKVAADRIAEAETLYEGRCGRPEPPITETTRRRGSLRARVFTLETTLITSRNGTTCFARELKPVRLR